MYNYRQLSVQFETPSLLHVVFDNPPINLVDHETLRELHELTSEMEASRDLKVALFENSNADFFLAHWDISSKARPASSASEAPSWTEISLRLANAPVVSLDRGRARGIGSEIALGCDMRRPPCGFSFGFAVHAVTSADLSP